ncbi:type I toxin-antitoxin system Ibs family toxin [Escherichia coli]|nr:type I toxin-antitoxin system Ibs family toxin [Escherichia coli]MBI1574949.1 type I toxin-antitoxin system Ibs family toxin [Escherichia coli]MBY7435272.1 type I toxin-antitoxin system Ibs family toxin [Escherichia coli]
MKEKGYDRLVIILIVLLLISFSAY